MNSRVLFVLVFLLVAGCKTSGDLARNRGREFVDPTAVVTTEASNPNAGSLTSVSADAEELQRQIEALKGQMEEERVASQKAQEILSAKVGELQEITGVR